jgi:hypothetical protein
MKAFQTFLGGVAIVLVSGAVLAQDIPLNNWTVPPYHRASASGGLSTMADVTPGIGFVGVTPCRLVDTRQAGFPAGYGQPALAGGVPRNFDLNNQPNCTGIPAGVEAYSLNITVTNTLGPGFILIYPQGGVQPSVSTVNYVGGQTIANAAIVPAGTGGGVTVIAGVSGTDLIIDINGYFTDEYNNGNPFIVTGTSDVMGIFLNAQTALSFGVEVLSATTANGGAAIAAAALGDTGVIHGVLAISASSALDGAAVLGQTNLDDDPFGGALSSQFYSGVRGESGQIGVLGIGEQQGVRGIVVSEATGDNLASGAIGADFGIDPSGGAPPWAFFGNGDIGASGVKFFVEPHATDPTMVIKYAALEGAEAGTYFRGRGKFQNGLARVAVPEDFRMVSDPEGLSVQVTPFGAMASVAVLRADLNEIVFQSSRDVEFYYLVQGVRATFKGLNALGHDGMFRPESADAKIPAWLSEGQKRLLIRNGTYREDGTVNMETAHRLGWDRIWERRQHPTPAPELAPASAFGLPLPTRP